MKKDYIYVYDSDGKKIKMEIVTIFQLKEFAYNYIIYKTLDNKHFYIAKYQEENIIELDTSLSQKELELAQKVLEGVVKDI